MINYKTIPNKYVRKAIWNALNGMVVNGVNLSVSDFRIPVERAPKLYLLMESQTATPAKTKCQYDWECTIGLELINQEPRTGNGGSRVLVNDAANMVVAAFNSNLVLEGGLTVVTQNIQLGNDSVVIADTFTVNAMPMLASFYIV